jgi:hypothetical protein
VSLLRLRYTQSAFYSVRAGKKGLIRFWNDKESSRRSGRMLISISFHSSPSWITRRDEANVFWRIC